MTHDHDVGGVLHQGPETSLALADLGAGLVRVVDQPHDAPGHADGGDPGDDGEGEGGARTGVVEDDDRGRGEQRGAEHDHAGASRRTGLGSPSQRLRIDGCITAAASRK